MKIKYEFINGDKSEIEVADEIGMIISDSRRKEENSERNTRRHCYSIDALKYGDKYVHIPYSDETPETIEILKEENKELYEAFSSLSDIQQRRLLMLASGMSKREIARQEKVHHSVVGESVDAARKKLKKFLKTPRQKR